MAGLSRDERQLMRQRGAGSRNVVNADFGFKFGAQDASREERQLMRQRGAGSRIAGNIDLAFSFPTPNQSRRSSKRVTPRSSRGLTATPNESNRKPRQASKELLRANSPTAITLLDQDRQSLQTPQVIAQTRNGSAKRRRLDINRGQVSSITRADRRRKSSGTFFEIAEEQDLQTLSEPVENSVPDSNHFHGVDVPPVLPTEDDKENRMESGTDFKAESLFPSSISAGQAPQRRSLRSSGSVQDIPVPSIENSIVENELEPNVNEDASYPKNSDAFSIWKPRSEQSKSVLPRDMKKRRKRKSVVLGRKKRRSSGNEKAVEEDVGNESVINEEESSIAANIESELISEESDVEPNASPVMRNPGPKMKSITERLLAKRRQRNRLSVSTSPVAQHVETEEVGDDETYVDDDENSPEPPTPAPQQKQRPTKKRKRTSTDGEMRSQQNKSKRSMFPILTHRMTNTAELPTIVEGEEESDLQDADGRALSTHYIDRSVPNAIDVLAQICRETVDSSITQLHQQQDSGFGRAELKRKQASLEVFGKDLNERLFDMSEAVEHRTTLEARLRKSRREKAELQRRWLEIRQQRDTLALRTDAIRRQNWESEQQAKQNWELSETLHRTEIELDRSESREEGLEFMLRDVAGLVSCASNEGGLLATIKAFNRRLEHLAAVL